MLSSALPTDKAGCCNNLNNGIGEWLFPNGTTLDNNGVGGNIYHDRTGATVRYIVGIVPLDQLLGLYHCVIPDSFGVDQTLFVGIYTTSLEKQWIKALIWLLVLLSR